MSNWSVWVTLHDMGSVIFKQSRSLIWVISTRSISCNSHSCKKPFKTPALKLGTLRRALGDCPSSCPQGPTIVSTHGTGLTWTWGKQPMKRQEALLQLGNGCRLPVWASWGLPSRVEGSHLFSASVPASTADLLGRTTESWKQTTWNF